MRISTKIAGGEERYEMVLTVNREGFLLLAAMAFVWDMHGLHDLLHYNRCIYALESTTYRSNPWC